MNKKHDTNKIQHAGSYHVRKKGRAAGHQARISSRAKVEVWGLRVSLHTPSSHDGTDSLIVPVLEVQILQSISWWLHVLVTHKMSNTLSHLRSEIAVSISMQADARGFLSGHASDSDQCNGVRLFVRPEMQAVRKRS
jgi:hypothetical protein